MAAAKKNLLIEEAKESELQGNFDHKHMDKKELNEKENRFKEYFYTVAAKAADKYYAAFVKNDYNDLEIVIQFARQDENESVSILCNDCVMNKMHARQLLSRLNELSARNKEFKNWFGNHRMMDYYEKMFDAGVVTFKMFESAFICPTDFVVFLGEEYEEDGMYMWRNMPLKKNASEKNVNNSSEIAFSAHSPAAVDDEIAKSGDTEGEGDEPTTGKVI